MKTYHAIYGIIAIIVFLMTGHLNAVTLSASGISVVSQSNGSVWLMDGTGTERATIGGYKINSANIVPGGGTATLVTINGQPTIQIPYILTGDTSGTTAITGQFTVFPYRVHAHFIISGASTLDLSTSEMLRQVISPTVAQSIVKLGLWNRDPNGGVPIENPDINAFTYGWSALSLLLYTPGANMGWNDTWSTHLPGVAGSSGNWTADADFSLMNARPIAEAAVVGGRSLSLDIWTAQSFNLWTTPGSGLPVSIQTANTSASPKNFTLTWYAKDFSGSITTSGSSTQSMAAGQIWNKTLTFAATTRTIFFVEVSVSDGTNTVFERTNLAVLPSHTFNSGSESIFGLSATFELSSDYIELGLVKRMGVRWLRQLTYSPSDASAAGITQNNATNTDWIDGPVATSWIDTQFSTSAANNCPYWEVGNEPNGHSGTTYVTNFLAPAKARQMADGSSVKIMNGGLSGMDTDFTADMYAAGGWNDLDAFALHPGRGNFTADYPGENGEITQPNSWTFLGAVRKANSIISSYGAKPLFLTETYAENTPNDGWADTTRHSAENVLLQYALAMEEKVKVMFFYQLNDTVWNDIGGVNATNTEYHYGLLNRDFSPKPSLLAYCTIAEALDQATFTRWMYFTDPKIHGLMFGTPSGPMAIIWDRADGYTLSPTTGTYAAPEAWVDPWPTKTNLSVPASGGIVTAEDCIGESTTLTASGGSVNLTLDGAPRIYYGLSSAAGAGAIVDNADATGVTVTGSWVVASSTAGFNGSNYLHDGNTGKGSKSVTFTPAITAAGNYMVYAKWPANANCATNVPIKIVYSGGNATVNVNQEINGGSWNPLGTYAFIAGTSGSVTIANTGTSGYVLADAIKFVKQ